MSEKNGLKAAPGAKMLEWFAGATAADLGEIDQAIADVDRRVGELLGHAASLRSLRRVIDLKVNGKPERKKPARTPKPARQLDGGLDRPAAPKNETTVERRKQIARLLGTGGPMMAAQIGNQLDMDGRAVAGLCSSSDWFDQTTQGYRLTATGRREAGL